MARLHASWSWMALFGTVLVLVGSFFMGLNFERANREAFAVGIPLVLLGLMLFHVRGGAGALFVLVRSWTVVVGAAVVFLGAYIAGMRAEKADFTGMVFLVPVAGLGLYVSLLRPGTRPQQARTR